jgi:hypothetical protein
MGNELLNQNLMETAKLYILLHVGCMGAVNA